LLAHNRQARFIWAHLGFDPGGQRHPALMRRLLQDHPNLYAAFRITPLDETGQLKMPWAALIRDFPDRFTLHTDIFYTGSWPPVRGPKESHEFAQRLLEQLPEETARRLAYENAGRLYKSRGRTEPAGESR